MSRSHASVGSNGWLADREEEAHRSPNCTLPWTPEQPSYTGTAERLAAFRAGHDVNVPIGGLAVVITAPFRRYFSNSVAPRFEDVARQQRIAR
jgi:hypothetical protein